MNANTIARPNNPLWLRRGIAVIGTFLISGTVALGMISQAPLDLAPEAAPAARVPSGRERYAAFKDAQATRVMDAAMGDVATLDVPVVNEWLTALKDLQLELRDAIFVPAPVQSSGRERYVALKDAQATRAMDAAMGNEASSAAPVVNERYIALKDAQAEAHDATFVPAPVQDTSRQRYIALKDAQAEARDTTFVPAPVQHSWGERYAALKDAQAEAQDATFVPAPVQHNGRARFAEFKQRQAELREGGR